MQCESQESLIDERETHNEETSEIIETIADVKVASKPDTPNPEEREEHEATHVEFRSWCRHCVEGRGREFAHATHQNGPREAPTVSFD